MSESYNLKKRKQVKNELNSAKLDNIMTVVFYAGLICDDVYSLAIARFEVLGFATAALSVVHKKSLTKGRKV